MKINKQIVGADNIQPHEEVRMMQVEATLRQISKAKRPTCCIMDAGLVEQGSRDITCSIA